MYEQQAARSLGGVGANEGQYERYKDLICNETEKGGKECLWEGGEKNQNTLGLREGAFGGQQVRSITERRQNVRTQSITWDVRMN